MKKIFISSLMLSSILLVGCGSDDDTKDDSKQSVDAVLSKSEAASGTPSGVDFNNKTSLRLKREQKVNKMVLKMSENFYKEETIACSDGGALSYDAVNKKISYSKCIDYNSETQLYEYHDGVMQLSQDEESVAFSNYYEELDYLNNPDTGIYWHIDVLFSKENNIENSLIDGEMKSYKNGYYIEEEKFSKLTLKENIVNKKWFIKGGYSYKGGCLDENHLYNTKETDWLVEDKDNSNYWSSGTLYIDNATYRYNNLDVTVEKQDKKGIFKQQELIDELERKKNSTDCSI